MSYNKHKNQGLQIQHWIKDIKDIQILLVLFKISSITAIWLEIVWIATCRDLSFTFLSCIWFQAFSLTGTGIKSSKNIYFPNGSLSWNKSKGQNPLHFRQREGDEYWQTGHVSKSTVFSILACFPFNLLASLMALSTNSGTWETGPQRLSQAAYYLYKLLCSLDLLHHMTTSSLFDFEHWHLATFLFTSSLKCQEYLSVNCSCSD